MPLWDTVWNVFANHVDHNQAEPKITVSSFFCALLVPKIVRDESGAFKMTPGCKKAWGNTKLEKVIECEGISIIDKSLCIFTFHECFLSYDILDSYNSELFVKSYEDCQRRSADPLLRLSPWCSCRS